jgi:predicted CoA-substrate-specific enzyme activase
LVYPFVGWFSISNYYIGINIGSVSVNYVSIDSENNINIVKKQHLGKPEEVLNSINKANATSNNYFGVSGSFGDVSEIVAVERGISSFDEKFDVVLSLGGEAIVLYVLNDKGHIVNVLSHDKCAAGSGEFFVQQIGRLGLTLEEAIALAKEGKAIEIASRCSVHCKSDITHKLNRGEASVEDLLASVLASMVNKVNVLLIQTRMKINRILAIGGVSLNEAFIKLLREELPDVEVFVKDVSPVFEAYGTALLVKDSPTNQDLTLKKSKSFSILPALHQFTKQVNIIEATDHKKDFDKKSSFILGVDVGSTTTKAVLVDPTDSEVIASFYGRTSGNPVKATRKCIEEIISQVGNCKINLVGVTGSGRQLVGAYLGTAAVYNEISAHSEGAVFYDPEVDTIFEIGGQDSKYMFLQNSVPVDYAMNATCSAGTGSFLEESAKGDLGVDVFNISQTAINAGNPVRFKADCAAFINTDIRTALQEGYGSDNIIGGLVYSIVDNYLNKVKGSRPVGKKVFFQGGVAKNHSVGFAFAEATGKQIIIPPNPELIGAFGIALIAKTKYEQHEINQMAKNTSLEGLIKEELKHLGSFTCKACENYCQIERYEVGGRKFNFGGSCTRYEHQWKGSEQIEEKENLVNLRNEMILGIKAAEKAKPIKGAEIIGVPRALLTHTLYPLFQTFFKELGFNVVLSDIDDDKELMTNAPFCYPVQVLHGAMVDLIKKDIKTIFLPHVHNMPKHKDAVECTFCPITQASPYIIDQAFKDVKLLNPVLDFMYGYHDEESLIDMAIKELNVSKQQAKDAYKKAVNKQIEIEQHFLELGEKTLKQLEETEEIGVLLLGRSYNAFPPETSLLIPKKLASMGVTVIPFDFLETDGDTNLTWYFSNYVKTAIDLTVKKDNLFVLYINSFSCTLDSFFQNYVRSEMHNKPYLFLELDAHTADAGIQTRLEAFLEIIKNYRASKLDTIEKPFTVAKVKARGGKVFVITSEGKRLDIKDSRVKLYLPSFSKFHTDIGEKVLSIYGFNVGKTTDIKLEYPVKGLRCSSGKECLPLPIVLGQILTLIENRQPGEVIGLYMIRGGSPCAVFSYFQYIEHFLESNRIENVFIYRFDFPTNYLGTKLTDVLRYAPAGIILGDLILEIESALQVVGKEGSVELLHKYWHEFIEGITTKKDFRRGIKKLRKKIKRIPRINSPKDSPKVLISGDFFVRYSPFFLRELKNIYAEHGIIVKSTDLLELGVYGQNFMAGYLVTKEWKKDPNHLSTILRASATLWEQASRLLLIGKLGTRLMLRKERKLRKRFSKTGLLYAYPNDLGELFRQSSPYISPLIFGEAIPTIGKGMETLEGSNFDSLILTGPFNCLPYKISQAILKPIYLVHNMPFLVFDVDISAITPNMRRLIHANIEQIKRRRSDPAFNEQMRIRSRIKGRVSKVIGRRMSRVAKRIRKRFD